MKLSTRSRYGVRMMVALAADHGNKPMFLKDIAASEDISEKYLSLIVIPLKTAGLIRSIRGARGGYVLAREPNNISLRDIVEAVEGETCLVNCVKNPDACDRVPICPTRDLWMLLGEKINETLENITLDQLADGRKIKISSGVIRRKAKK
jgi:Rrf2 family protein